MNVSARPVRTASEPISSVPLVEVRDLVRTYGRGDRADVVRAVDGVSFDVPRGETFGIVGESGSGKSTVARLMIGLERPTAGSVSFAGIDVHAAKRAALRDLRQRQQLVFQDPTSSLNRRKTVEQSLSAPLEVYGWSRQRRRARVRELIDMVGLSRAHAVAYPSELSGGQAQRVAIARALALEPELVILDEAVSSLDVSVQAQILNLLRDLQRELGLTYVFIAHDLAIVHFMATRIAVMYNGRVVELAGREELFSRPQHPYTCALLAAIPEPDPGRGGAVAIKEAEPPADAMSIACAYRPRCPLGRGEERCGAIEPDLVAVGPDHSAACHFPRRASEVLAGDGKNS